MAAVEAMASGLALITSDCRGTREYMKDGITGFICERNRPESYAEAVQRLRDDPEGHRSMEKESRRQALSFSREATESSMRQIYEKASEWRQQCPTEKLPL